MTNLTEIERKGIVRSLALALVEHMGVEQPPIWVESLLKNPPTVYAQRFPLVEILHKVLGVIFVWSSGQGGDLLIPSDLPLVERRFILAQELLNALMHGLQKQAAGSSKFLLPDLRDMSDYFARVLLAPDPLVEAYREEGKDLRGFAETFLIPERVASERWQDPISPQIFSEKSLHFPFSFS